MHTKIAPSLLAADFLNLGKDITMLNENADLIHLDIMDGILVPNISFGFSVVDALAPMASIPTDAHLMIVHPENYFERFASKGVSMLSFHLEAALMQNSDPSELLSRIKALGISAGLAFNPDIPIESCFPYLKDADFILVMSVFAGFGGQKFIPETISRVKALKSEIERQGLSCAIEVDGGVNQENAPLLVEAGAGILVAGSSVFKSSDPGATIKALRG